MKEITDLFVSSNHTIIYTGAGMSTESGLPDFRSKSRGLWEKFNPEEFTDFYRHRLSEVTQYKPHEGHQILANWESQGLVKGVITQNVDGFHHDAGSKNVMELHGTFQKFHCHACQENHPREAYLNGDTTCRSCGGIIRPGIVLFGESLPQDVFLRAEQESLKADLFIVLGSSLSVTPANMFPLEAKDHGAKLVIINREPTQFDMYVDYVVQDRNIKEILIEMDQFV